VFGLTAVVPTALVAVAVVGALDPESSLHAAATIPSIAQAPTTKPMRRMP